MNILLELFVVTFRVLWAFVLAAAKWLVRPKEKSVAGQVCLITGAGSGLGRLFALEFARRRALLVLWDINTQSNEETAGMVRHIYRELAEAAPKGKRGCALPLGAHLRPAFPGELPPPPPPGSISPAQGCVVGAQHPMGSTVPSLLCRGPNQRRCRSTASLFCLFPPLLY